MAINKSLLAQMSEEMDADASDGPAAKKATKPMKSMKKVMKKVMKNELNSDWMAHCEPTNFPLIL